MECDDGTEISSRVYGGREDGVMGSLAAGGVAQSDWAAFGKPSSSIYNQVAPHGGIRPAARRRSRLALTLSGREEISRGIAVHQSA
jgi:hypothetical protein